MRPIAFLFLLALPMSGFAADDITVDRATNIFNTDISVASTTMRAVRLGRNGAIPTVALNIPGYAPVLLGNVAGKLTYNGVAIATSAFVGDSMSIVNDLAVGNDAAITRDLAVTRNATVGGTIIVTGAAAAATLNTGNGAYELYKMDQNVDTTASPAFVAASVTGGPFQLYSRSKVQILGITPSAVGQAYYCNDCAAKGIVVSTGTGIGNFALANGASF